MNDFHSDYWSRTEGDAKLAEKRTAVAARLARVLGVPADEVSVCEHPEAQGLRLVGQWCPS